MTNRWDETWHRLREWTNGQGHSERLAAQILLAERFEGLDPSHPLGGKDGGKDAICHRDGKTWVMAVYFPRGQQSFDSIRAKFAADLTGATANAAQGFAFVTNQELRLAERKSLGAMTGDIELELYHLERITAILDQPPMAGVRQQFLGLEAAVTAPVSEKWVSDAYIERAGIAEGLRSRGYRLWWVDANHEAEAVDCDGWEYVEVDDSSGSGVKLKIRDHAGIGGYLVLLKKKE